MGEYSIYHNEILNEYQKRIDHTQIRLDLLMEKLGVSDDWEIVSMDTSGSMNEIESNPNPDPTTKVTFLNKKK